MLTRLDRVEAECGRLLLLSGHTALQPKRCHYFECKGVCRAAHLFLVVVSV